MQDNIIRILWTGGWDSTYRIIQLSRRGGVTLQPIYVEDKGRGSVAYELKAIEELSSLISQRESVTILPLIIVDKDKIPENPEITEAYLLFKKEADMGSQHDWLARLALQYPGMELCIEKALGDHAPIRQSINRHGKLIDTGDGYIVDKQNSSKELNLVLGNLKLPIFDKTEKDMKDDIHAWGYDDVMSHIWFCHRPIHDKPCGLCNPCTTKMTSDMAYLLPEAAQKRNIRMRAIEKKLGKKEASYYRRIARKIAR